MYVNRRSVIGRRGMGAGSEGRRRSGDIDDRRSGQGGRRWKIEVPQPIPRQGRGTQHPGRRGGPAAGVGPFCRGGEQKLRPQSDCVAQCGQGFLGGCGDGSVRGCGVHEWPQRSNDGDASLQGAPIVSVHELDDHRRFRTVELGPQSAIGTGAPQPSERRQRGTGLNENRRPLGGR